MTVGKKAFNTHNTVRRVLGREHTLNRDNSWSIILGSFLTMENQIVFFTPLKCPSNTWPLPVFYPLVYNVVGGLVPLWAVGDEWGRRMY